MSGRTEDWADTGSDLWFSNIFCQIKLIISLIQLCDLLTLYREWYGDTRFLRSYSDTNLFY